MKLGHSTIVAIVVASCFSLTAYVMGMGRSGGHAGGRSAFGMSNSAATTNPHIKTSPTPPGKHLGWQKGKHNPHKTPTP